MKIKGVALRDSAGNIFDFPLIEKNDLPWFNYGNIYSWGGYSFYFEGNDLVVAPTPSNNPGLYIDWTYCMRPNELVPTSEAMKVTAINSPTQVVVDAVPSTITTSTPVDVIKGTPGFECRAIDQAINTIVGTTVTFSTAVPGLTVNDYVALAQQSPFPQIPVELRSVLAQRTAIKILEGIGDFEAMERAERKLEKSEKNALHLISPRSDSNPKKVFNRFSPLRCR